MRTWSCSGFSLAFAIFFFFFVLNLFRKMKERKRKRDKRTGEKKKIVNNETHPHTKYWWIHPISIIFIVCARIIICSILISLFFRFFFFGLAQFSIIFLLSGKKRRSCYPNCWLLSWIDIIFLLLCNSVRREKFPHCNYIVACTYSSFDDLHHNWNQYLPLCWVHWFFFLFFFSSFYYIPVV